MVVCCMVVRFVTWFLMVMTLWFATVMIMILRFVTVMVMWLLVIVGVQ